MARRMRSPSATDASSAVFHLQRRRAAARPGVGLVNSLVTTIRLNPLLALLALSALPARSAAAEETPHFDTKAGQAFVIDAETGTVLFSKDPDRLIPPASLAKLMTAEVIFDAVKSGRRSLDESFAVSEHAWRTGGAPSGTATMFAAITSEVPLRDLIQGIVVQQANDGCIIAAEGMAGSEEDFVRSMNERARQLGFTRSVFRNATGLPAEGQVTTVRELALLGLHLWKEYPELYKYYAQPDFTWNKIFQRNRNPLLAMGIGADGYGYSIVASASQNGRRVFAAMGGTASEKERAEEARAMIDWAMKSFDRKRLFADGEVVGEASVYGGDTGSVPLKAKGPIDILVPNTDHDRIVARIVYRGPLVAPVEQGVPVGSLKVWLGDMLTQETPLYTAASVGRGSLGQRAFDAIAELLTGWLRTVLNG
jgi:D-alanyl-D-alanine carboxypeptidase (penicillin-binding protein 5/6)